MTVRDARPSDREGVLAVHRAAFGSGSEAQLVADLLDAPDADPIISVLAEDEGTVVAHVLLTSGQAPGHPEVKVQLLAPWLCLRVTRAEPVGTQVTQAALREAREAGVDCVCVLGHPTYYPRFGFEPLLPHGPLPRIDPAPEHSGAWMTLLLGVDRLRTASALDGVRLTSAGPLDEPGLWGPD